MHGLYVIVTLNAKMLRIDLMCPFQKEPKENIFKVKAKLLSDFFQFSRVEASYWHWQVC